jgi:hypothetical protein
MDLKKTSRQGLMKRSKKMEVGIKVHQETAKTSQSIYAVAPTVWQEVLECG